MDVAPTREGKGGVDRVTWSLLLTLQKKQGADSVLQSNFSSHQKGDPVSLAWKIKRSTRLIIFLKKTNINLNVLIRHLFFSFSFFKFPV